MIHYFTTTEPNTGWIDIRRQANVFHLEVKDDGYELVRHNQSCCRGNVGDAGAPNLSEYQGGIVSLGTFPGSLSDD